MKKLLLLLLLNLNISILNAQENNDSILSDQEKAIKAVNEGEILTLDQILEKINSNFNGRVISINLKDNEKGLFGWVYDIMIIDIDNKVRQIRVDAGTATVLSVISGE
ncbi:MAG: PepSY domain-containing protein [Alphaproteobacteria bacterium]|tara:strand:+ start:278 stop:601 length:324 start_codon:yes stop_codon:yes gene_type:complete